MSGYRVLIVDDDWDIAHLLRSGIETLGESYEVVSVPSGEEALLEVGKKHLDLLISDVHLPGISGLELMRRLKERNPDLKLILVTGVSDAEVRRQVADAGANAFFLKPIEIADFLDTVERVLGAVASVLPAEVIEVESPMPHQSISECLTVLRRKLEAFSAALLDIRGKILVQAGDLPDATLESALMPTLMTVFNASSRAAILMNQPMPENFLSIGGKKYDLFFAHVGESYGLLVMGNKVPVERMGEVNRQLQSTAQDIISILTRLGVPLQLHEQRRPPLGVYPEESEVVDQEEVVSELEALLGRKGPARVKSDEAEEFWEKVVEEEGGVSEVLNADVLSYDQAVQLGLTPSESET
ncbi:MAG: response regulator [Chloroflexota bacterium]